MHYRNWLRFQHLIYISDRKVINIFRHICSHKNWFLNTVIDQWLSSKLLFFLLIYTILNVSRTNSHVVASASVIDWCFWRSIEIWIYWQLSLNFFIWRWWSWYWLTCSSLGHRGTLISIIVWFSIKSLFCSHHNLKGLGFTLVRMSTVIEFQTSQMSVTQCSKVNFDKILNTIHKST